jgi:hypothetical protein
VIPLGERETYQNLARLAYLKLNGEGYALGYYEQR